MKSGSGFPNPGLSAKRDIAKAFGIKGDARIELKACCASWKAKAWWRRAPAASASWGVAAGRGVAGAGAGCGTAISKPLEEGVDEGPRILVIRRRAIRPWARGPILARLSGRSGRLRL
jgi:ribonuclease R